MTAARLLLDEAAIEMGVFAAGGDERGVRAPLDDSPVVEHEHLIGVADRAQPMGDDEARAARQAGRQSAR